MQTLIFSDIHAHNYREFSETIFVEGKAFQDSPYINANVNSRLLDQIKVLRAIRNQIEESQEDSEPESGIREVWFLGDMFHLKNNLDTQVVKLILAEFVEIAKFVRKIRIVAGNHDYRMWSGEPALLELFEEYVGDCSYPFGDANVYSMPGWTGVVESEPHIYAEPYTRKVKEADERLEKVEPKENAIFLGHQDIKGAQYGAFKVEHGLDPDILSQMFKWSFLGHWHSPTKIRENVISIGATLQHNFGDVGGARGWWVYDDEKDTIEFTENTFSPRFYDVKADSKTISVPGDLSKDFYRIKVTGTGLPEQFSNITWKRVSYEVATKEKGRGDLKFSDAKETILEKYIKLRGGDLDHEKLIKLGRGYL